MVSCFCMTWVHKYDTILIAAFAVLALGAPSASAQDGGGGMPAPDFWSPAPPSIPATTPSSPASRAGWRAARPIAGSRTSCPSWRA